MSTTSLWIYGCIGGALPILVRIAKSGTAPEVPTFWHWWLLPATVVSAFLGGLLVNVMDLQKAAELTGFSQKLTVLLVGYAAPNILANLAGIAKEKVAPDPTPPPAAPAATVTRFLRA